VIISSTHTVIEILPDFLYMYIYFFLLCWYL